MSAVTRSDPVLVALSIAMAAFGPGAFATVDDFAEFVVGISADARGSEVLRLWLAMGGFPPLQELEEEGGNEKGGNE